MTGHTGFVGGWLCAWLGQLGAKVSGYSLAPPSQPNFYTLFGLESRLARSETGDVRDPLSLAAAIGDADPQVVFHLAAQPIVREAHRDPVGTFATNVMGTVNVLQACRGRAGLERLVLFTTDKVYRNDQSGRPFVEADRVGGNEPYSASKAAAEWAIAAWWESYYRGSRPPVAVSSVRAGNIVGGGDWGRDRLVPDAVRAFAAGAELVIRNPGSTRPWQHVLDAVRGALLLAEKPPADRALESLGWNFGPADGEVRAVADVAALLVRAWGPGARWRHEPDASIPESRALVLSSARASAELGWRAAWGLERTIEESVAWYRAAQGSGDLVALTERQIDGHCTDAGRVAA